MSDHEALSRRRFLQATLAGSAALASAPLADAIQQDQSRLLAAAGEQKKPGQPLPRRKLGRSGPEVSILSLGGMMTAHNPRYLDMAWDLGIRYFDTADCYINGQSEKNIARWLAAHPERRKELFLVSKDHPTQGPGQLLTMIDTRLKACGTDYLDLFFIHGIGTQEYGQGSLEWPRSKELRQVAEQLKQSGKVKLVGFSCHDKDKVRYLNAAAEGGFIDAIMVAYDPLTEKGDDLRGAMDACAKAGIGLVAMKTLRGHKAVPKRLPELDKLGLTTAQALMHNAWSDERLAAICCNIENTQELASGAEAARKFKGALEAPTLDSLRKVALACGPRICPNCDGRCARAAGAELALSDIARYVNYYEQDGSLEARELYRALPEELRRAAGADLAAAQHVCHCQLDFAQILEKAERYFA